MPELVFQVDVLWLVHESRDVCLAVPLLFPELAELGDSVTSRNGLLRRVVQVLGQLPASEIHRRQPHGELELRTLELDFPPPDSARTIREAWELPVRLRFHYVLWQHDAPGAPITIGYVPVLNIELLGSSAQDVEDRLPSEISFALRRSAGPVTLRQLCRWQQCRAVRIERLTVQVDVRTPRQRAESAHEEDAEESLLGSIVSDVTMAQHAPAYERSTEVGALAEFLSGRAARSVLLVGPPDVGKTAVVHELIRRRGELGLADTPFWTTSGARIVAGACGFGMWEQRCDRLIRETVKSGAVLHLGGLVELMQVGKAEGQNQSVGDYLGTAISRGTLRVIAECTAEELARLEPLAPRTVQAFIRLDVREPDQAAGRAILEQCAAQWATSCSIQVDTESLDVLDRLHRQYATYSAYPGRPLRFLRRLLEQNAVARAATPAEVTAAFSRETGLPAVILDDEYRFDLPAIRDWFGQRIIGQDDAVDTIVDLLASVKSGLAPPGRPLASLLFVGPTGVGKTEMAKTLAEFLYQDRRRLVRIDMSEYADDVSVERLIGGAFGTEGVLTASVREQPFGVVLLDEFEKAHPRLYDLLLQVTGEARLTDATGRLADFRNTVIIMTSNLGTESFRQDPFGFSTGQPSRARTEHFEQAVRSFLRPELFNRLDRIVSFQPLSRATLEQIALRELAALQLREGILHRNVALRWGEDVPARLVAIAHDPRYGARPLQRAVNRHLAAPLAAVLADRGQEERSEAVVDVRNGQFSVTVRVVPSDEAEPIAGAGIPDRETALASSAMRRQVLSVQCSGPVQAIRNEVFRLRKQLERRAHQSRSHAGDRRGFEPDQTHNEQLEALSRILERVDQLATDACQSEDHVLGACYRGEAIDSFTTMAQASALAGQLDELYLELYCREFPVRDVATLAVYRKADNPLSGGVDVNLFALARAYRTVARHFSCLKRVALILSSPPKGALADNELWLGVPHSTPREKSKRAVTTRRKAQVLDPSSTFLEKPGHTPIGIALELGGPDVYPRFLPEAGIHQFGIKSVSTKYRVHVAVEPLRDYRPPEKIERSSALSGQKPRRIYSAVTAVIDDRELGVKQHWSGKRLGDILPHLCQSNFIRLAKEWVHAG